jgi:hypothetical protein
MKQLWIVTFFMTLAGNSFAQSLERTSTNQDRYVQFAERVVAIELAKALSPSVRLAKQQCGPGCAESGALELGVEMIGLMNLLGLRLDGAGAEELHCQILLRGRDISGLLRTLKPNAVAEHCRSLASGVMKRELATVSDVSVDQLCRSAEEVNSERGELLKAVASNAACPF